MVLLLTLQIFKLTMEVLLSNLKISVQETIYNKDPESSNLGRRILEHSIDLLNEIGFEAFTFKKLGEKIGSNESSIYRYFDNKHKLLVYLSSWYWTWMEYRLVVETYSINNPIEKLRKAIEITTNPTKGNTFKSHIDVVKLNQVMISESPKSFLTKEVDKENREGYFNVYKRLINGLKNIILEILPEYDYAASLASTTIETSLHQHFLKDHFPGITDYKKGKSLTQFLTDMVFRTLNIDENE